MVSRTRTGSQLVSRLGSLSGALWGSLSGSLSGSLLGIGLAASPVAALAGAWTLAAFSSAAIRAMRSTALP
jgi:hypothetical protein